MAKTLESAVCSYLKARSLSPASRVEYRSTLSKWSEWGKEVPLESINRSEVREFLDWVHERATEKEGTNPGRTANKCREPFASPSSRSLRQKAAVPRDFGGAEVASDPRQRPC